MTLVGISSQLGFEIGGGRSCKIVVLGLCLDLNAGQLEEKRYNFDFQQLPDSRLHIQVYRQISTAIYIVKAVLISP